MHDATRHDFILAEILRVMAGVLSTDVAPEARQTDVAPEAYVARTDPHASFFDLGIDSVGALKLVTSLRAELGVELSVVDVWEFRSPARLAAHLAGESPNEEAALPADVQPLPASGPVAIVGVACRLPEAADPSAFWDLLAGGRNATREVPRQRSGAWAKVDEDSSVPGTVNTGRAAFLENVDCFDASFFRISPREAREVDPQQRLGLELAWEALEDAGIPPDTLHGTRTGVFVGCVWSDYGKLAQQDLAGLTQHSGVGQDVGLVAGRISYVLGTHGPSLTVNTACSSSLVALHLAAQSLRAGESRTALVGGVTLMISPASTVTLARFGGLAPDGLSKAFSADADGFGRGEGGVFLVVKPLADAVRDGDRIHAVLRGSAVNADGASNGITAPNPVAQEALLREAYKAAAVSALGVDYVEAHGTGTALGDPIEARALGAVLGKTRPPERPLRIGSVKTNVGHTEGAAGLAGLLKVVLSMRRRILPQSLHAEKLSPHIAWGELGLQVCQRREVWPRERHEPLLAGVSAFGWGGTNAHAVLERPPSGHVRLHLLEEPSAEDLADRVRELCGEHAPEGLIADGDTATEGPSRWRAALLEDEDGLGAGRWELVSAPRPVTAERHRPKVVFVCPPQGGQWAGMAVDLLLSEPVFRRQFLACDQALAPHLGVSMLRCLLEGERYEARIADPDRVQPMLFALQVSLAALLESLGVAPDVLVGHSIGEVAAAHLSGAISLPDAARVLGHYTGLQVKIRGTGRMAVVGRSPEEVREALAGWEGVSVAAVNGPATVIVAGPEPQVVGFVKQQADAGHFVSLVKVNVGAHSVEVDPLLDTLRSAVGDVATWRPRVPLVLSVIGEPLGDRPLDGAYWARNLRETVRFREAVEHVDATGPHVFVELCSHPVLVRSLCETLQAAGNGSFGIATLRKGAFGPAEIRRCVGHLFAAGARVAPRQDPFAGALPLLLSGGTPAALADQAARWAAWLDAHPETSWVDVLRTAALHRTHFDARAAVQVGGVAEASEALRALAEGRFHPAVSVGQATAPADRRDGKLAVLFTGQGSQRPGMGRDLHGRSGLEAFTQAFDAAAAACDAHLERPLVEVMWAEEGEETALLHRTRYTQPALFVLETALFAQWQAWGVVPDVVLGHSVGELVAAHVAGVLSPEDAAALVCARGRLMEELATAGGAMASLEASEEEARTAVARLGEALETRVDVAGLNTPSQTLVSGDAEAVDALVAHFEATGRQATRLTVSHAFHSPHMDGMLEAFRQVAAALTYNPPSLPVVSNVTGKPADVAKGELVSAEYWVRHVRQAVRFVDEVRAAVELGATTFLECGPDAVLCGMTGRCVAEDEEAAGRFAMLPSLRKDQEELPVLLSALGGLHVRGRHVEWPALVAAGGFPVGLPTYAFQRQSYWLEARHAEPYRRSSGTRRSSLLGTALRLAHAPGHHLFETRLDERWDFLDDHKVQDTVILPGTASVELALSGAEGLYGKGPRTLHSMDYVKALFIPPGTVPTLQILFSPAGAGELSFEIRSCDRFSEDEEAAEPSWTLHVRGKLRGGEDDGTPAPFDTRRREALLGRCPQRIPGEELYVRHAARGNDWGVSFQGIEELWLGESEAVARLRVPAGLVPQLARFQFHPAVLDACGQTLSAAIPEGKGGENGFVLGHLERFRFYDSPRTRTLWAVVTDGVEATPEALTGRVEVFDDDGCPLAVFEGLRLSYLDALEVPARQPRSLDEWLYEVEWPLKTPASPPATADSPGNWLVLTDRGGVGAALCSLLEEHGQSVVRVAAGETYESSDSGSYRLDPGDPEQLRRLFAEAAVEAWTGVVYLWSLDAGEAPSESSQTLACGGAALLISTLTAVAQGAAPRLWLVTRGAQPAGPDDGPIAAAQATLWGLGRSVMLEHPELRATLVDLDAAGEADVTPLWREISSPDGEDQIALRGGERRVARLVRHTAAAESERSVSPRPDASYLVTGGLGGLGLVVGRWLVEQGARHLVLLGRTALPPRPEWDRRAAEDAGVAEKVAAIRDLEARGAQVELDAVDVADEESLRRFWRQLSQSGRPPLRGVVHAAGVIHYQALAELDLEEFHSVQRAKVYGGWLLDRLCADVELDFFVLYSSISALLSSPLLAGYAAGNAFLDALAHDRRRRGRPALSVDWGLWGEVGMAVAQSDKGRNLASRGMGTLTSKQGLEVLGRLLEEGPTQVGVLPIDWRQWSEAYPEASRSPLLTDLVERETAGPPSTVSGRQSLLAAPPEQRGQLAGSLLRQQVSQTLGIEAGQLDASQPLTRLGLDSLMAMELKNRVRESLGLDLPLMRWLQGLSLGQLTADVLERLSEATPVSTPTPLLARAGRASSDTGFPLSYTQQSVWHEMQLYPESSAYNLLFAAHVHSPVDTTALRRAFEALVERHAILRTTYRKGDEGSVWQVVLPAREMSFEVVDAATWTRGQLDERLLEAAHQPFDLEKDSVLRVRLFTRSTAEHTLLVAIHHIASDLWSLGIVLRELDQLYPAMVAGTEAVLPPPEVEYTDYVRWHEEMLSGAEGERLEAFWRRQLADGDPPELILPLQRPRQGRLVLEGKTLFCELDAGLIRRIKAFARQQGSTPHAALLTVYQVLLHRLSGQDVIPVCCPMVGRSRNELQSVLGHFVNMVPLRGDLSGDPRFTELLVRTQAEVLAVVEHQDYPAALMVRRLLKRDSAQSRLFDVEFVFDSAAMDAHGIAMTLAQDGARRRLGGLSLETIALPQQAGQFDLSLDLLETGGKVSGFLMYKTALFDATTVLRFFEQFKTLSEGVLAAPERRISDLPLLSPAELHQLTVELPGDLAGTVEDATVEDDTVKSVYVLDRKLQPQPLGCYGRVAYSGVAAGRGESHGAAKTALRFVPDPFAGRPGSRLLLTHELGRRLANGRLELLGRRAERSSGEVDRDPEAELGELFDEVLGELDPSAVEVQA